MNKRTIADIVGRNQQLKDLEGVFKTMNVCFMREDGMPVVVHVERDTPYAALMQVTSASCGGPSERICEMRDVLWNMHTQAKYHEVIDTYDESREWGKRNGKKFIPHDPSLSFSVTFANLVGLYYKGKPMPPGVEVNAYVSDVMEDKRTPGMWTLWKEWGACLESLFEMLDNDEDRAEMRPRIQAFVEYINKN